ncbi:MAG: cytochrome P450 [Verrucomicrobia bacterium]|nr:cytochrome P450 [Verrucomicrobiota bacterium]MBV9274204.1 cytochrome P450 [Verrucomicrobiota bacterium]
MALPDGPKASGVYQMLQWVATPFRFMRECYRRYGDCFTIRLSQRFGPLVLFSHPQALQIILTNDDGKLFDAPGEINVLLQPVIGTQSIIGLSGDRHRRARQLLMPPFHGERMRSYGALIQEITEQVMSRQEAGNPFPARKPMQATSLRVVLRAIFGLQDGFRYRQLEKLMTAMLDGLGNPASASLLFFPMLRRDFGPQSPWGRFIRNRQQIDELIYAEISDRRRAGQDGERADILSLLLSARDETGATLTDVELRDELMTLLTAGHETTASALTWALYWIHRLPEVRYRLLEELNGLNGELDPAAVSRLPYLNAVCSETLRIHPVALLTFPRIVRSRVELMGISMEPGTIVTGCIYLAHRRPEVYPEPDQFKPDRFLDRHYSPFEFLPFGGGIRRCIGMAFAQFEMKLVLSTLLTRFELSLANGRTVKHRRRGVTSGPSPFRMVLGERKTTSGDEREQAGAEVTKQR